MGVDYDAFICIRWRDNRSSFSGLVGLINVISEYRNDSGVLFRRIYAHNRIGGASAKYQERLEADADAAVRK